MPEYCRLCIAVFVVRRLMCDKNLLYNQASTYLLNAIQMSVHWLYLDINKGKIYTCDWNYIFILCLIKLSPRIIYLLHIKMLYFAFAEFFL